MTKTVVSLSDRYDQLTGDVLLSSMQALVRLPVDQARRDRAAGLNTGGYVTGYRGSPITTLDAQLWSAKKLLDAHNMHFEPGLNEELAATSLRGTQQLDWFGKARFEGVFAMWYAKGLGVDRACEALKLANFEGTHAKGGVLVVAGDDHAAKSSASAHQSEHTLIAGFLPILAPSTTEEILRFGQLGWEMSRYSGLYVSLKTVTDTLDLTTTTTLPVIDVVRPEWSGREPLNIRRSLPPLVQESLVLNERLPAATLFARTNGFDRVAVDGGYHALTIVTAGKAYLDVQQALMDLGLDKRRCAELGLRVVKIGMVWPLDPEFVRQACAGSRELLVVEEKRPVIEEQLAVALYGLNTRPAIIGKRDPAGRALFPQDGVLDPIQVRRAISSRLHALGLADDALRAREAELQAIEQTATAPVISVRPAYFCSGCPHNTSTNVPDGSFAMGATGCHGLAAFMPERRTMNVVGMGAEGLPWIGAQHFVETQHVFANMGDGTYTHSGILAIRAALAAKANVTFKLLYNDAVAMTGGQPLEGGLQPDAIVRELLAEGVSPVVMVSDNPDTHQGKLPAEVTIRHRDALDAVQRELREQPGVTAIVYEQTCANEKRRRRKRGNYPDPDLRLYINPAVCEGCGDCSRQSNCVSVTPIDTEFGRKRSIDQSNCNKDYSCIKGFCPSFVSVRGGKPARRSFDAAELQPLIDKLPVPAVADTRRGYSMLVTGIGGTGVMTIGAVLGMAAHLEGKAAKVLDMTGMAQKGGGVSSHIRFAPSIEAIPSSRVGIGAADLLIACDLVVASGPDIARSLHPGTQVIANADVVPTGEFQTKPDLAFNAARFVPAIEQRTQNIALVEANALARTLMGDTIFTNLLMLGYAAQRGLMPVSLDALTQALHLNGGGIEANLRAVAIGRIAAAFPDALAALLKRSTAMDRPYPTSLPEMMASRGDRLTLYQNKAYAAQHATFVEQVAARLAERGVGDAERFLMTVADQLARLMGYKDEYEVARLYTHPAFKEGLKSQLDGDMRLSFNLAPPLLWRARDERTGRPKKTAFASWLAMPMFQVLTRMKRLRGTALDPFGYTAERRTERALPEEYKALILSLVETLDARSMEEAIDIAQSTAVIRGYGPVKEEGLAEWRKQLPRLLEAFEDPIRREQPIKVAEMA